MAHNHDASNIYPHGHEAQLKIHFSAPAFTVPTLDDINKKYNEGGKIHEWAGVKIVRLSPTLVVKFGSRVAVAEAKNMRFVLQHSQNIPVPEVFAYCTYGPISRDIDDYGSLFDTYIFMSYVDGQTLDIAWESYDNEAKARVSSQLKKYLDDLRSINEASYIGSSDYGPVLDPILASYSFQGPFSSEEDFSNTIINAYLHKAPKQHVKGFLAGMVSQKNHRIVFTHGDFRPQNIMVKDGEVTGLIDWELSGWYPEYWEFAKSLCIWRWQNDWGDYLMQILRPYYPEYAFHSFVSSILW